MHVPNLSLYHAFVSYYQNKVTDKYNHHITDRHGRKFKFWSKEGGLISPKTGKLAFEYALHWQSEDKASKCYLAFKPLFGAGTKTKKGKTLNLTQVGVNIEVESSYFELEDILEIYEDILEEIDAARFKEEIDFKNSPITQMARHARYHEKHEGDIVNMLMAIEEESTMRGDSHLVKDVSQGNYQMFKIDIPSFDVCGIETKYKHGVKSYRIKNFLKRHHTDPLKHPKLEVYLNRSEQKRQPDGYPTLDQYYDVRNDLDQLLIKLVHFVTDDLTYVPDSYFEGKTLPHRGEPLPKWDYSKLKERPEVPLNDNSVDNAGLRFLSFIAFDREGSATFSDIIKGTGISERSAWRYLKHYKEQNLLESHRAKETTISFKHKGGWITVRNSLKDLSRYLNFGYWNYCGHLIKDTGKTRNYKDRYKDLVKNMVYKYDDSVIRCDSHQQANELNRDLKKAGLKRKISVVSGSPRLS